MRWVSTICLVVFTLALASCLCSCSDKKGLQKASVDAVQSEPREVAGAGRPQAGEPDVMPSSEEPELQPASSAGADETYAGNRPWYSEVDLDSLKQRLDVGKTETSGDREPGQNVSLPSYSLAYYLDRVWGLRLGSIPVGIGLESQIGPPPYEVKIDTPLGGVESSLIPMEIVVVAGKKELLVNNLKVADVVDVATAGATPDYQVSKEEGHPGIGALAAQARQYLELRAAFLRSVGLGPDVLEDCNTGTVFIDEGLHYGIAVEILQSLAFAGVFESRFAVKDGDELVSFVTFSMPHLNSDALVQLHLAHDDWWQQADRPVAGHEFAYLGYVPSEEGDDWAGDSKDPLVCMPSWLRNGRVSLSAADGGRIKRSVNQAHQEFFAVGADREAAGRAGRATGAPSRLSAAQGGELAVLALDPARRVPFVYVKADGYVVVLRDMLDDKVLKEVTFRDGEVDLMKEYLRLVHPERAVLHLGADVSVPTGQVLRIAGTLKYACDMETMAGDCLGTRPWLAPVYPFVAPSGVFQALAPQTPDETARKPAAEARRQVEKKRTEETPDVVSSENSQDQD